MLTLLSRSICLLLDRARRRAAPPGSARAPAARAPDAAESNEIGGMPVPQAAHHRPGLRLVAAPDAERRDRDRCVAESAWRTAPKFAPGAASFIAGQGARLYSLDAFRPARRGPRDPGPSHTPHAA